MVERTARKNHSRPRRQAAAALIAVVAVVALAACSPSGANGGKGAANGDGHFDFLSLNGNTTVKGTIAALGKTECAAEEKAMPLKTDELPATNLDQKLQLLVSQNALSDLNGAFATPTILKEAAAAGKIGNVETVLGKDADNILPAAKQMMKTLYGGSYAFPTELNIDGFFYNKKIFADNGLSVPLTWDDLLKASKTLQAAGVQPQATFLAVGGDPTTHMLGNYIQRDLGKDAFDAVASGKAKLTDPEYVKAADAIAGLTKEGFYGKNPGSGTDYNTQTNQFLTGQAAMLYTGSWSVPAFNDASQNKIGVDNIGFFVFPAVAGGKGSIDDLPVNPGIPAMIPATTNRPADATAWLKCLARNYGNGAAAFNGQVTGFKVTKVPDNLSSISKTVLDKVTNSKSTILWFSAQFPAKAGDLSYKNGGSLASGQLTGAQFMQVVQAGMK